MRQLVVISGKGGTGKTTLVGAFAALATNPVLADCDVDAANLRLLLDPQTLEEGDFTGPLEPRIDAAACTGCGACVEACVFGALATEDDVAALDPVVCEGCGLCARVCPAEAIAMERVVAGRWFVAATRFGPLVHARLGVAQENSGKLVTLVRRKAAELAEAEDAAWLLVDGSPGIGCPVIASLAGADGVLAVAEPTLSGQSDLGRVLDLAAHFQIPALVCVNKWDINPGLAEAMEADAQRRGCRLAGRIPYDDAVPRSVVQGKPLVEFDDGPAAQAARDVWRASEDALAHEPAEGKDTDGEG
ncbi:MAG: ATP-binding protein [Candidatus Brocadiia bacterium]